EALHCRSGTVGGQLQHRAVAQLLPPVNELGLQPLALQVLSLPNREVCVLDRQFRQRRGVSGRKGFIERSEFLEEDPQRPPIKNNMMYHQQQHIIGLAALQQTGPNEWALRQIEWALSLCRRQSVSFLLPCGFG